ncbi:hypothetical protein J6590_024025 [Homalodisca vitripennis]|nr:hypothetical protein J6590_024025 [Homalodisca vitripennis]
MWKPRWKMRENVKYLSGAGQGQGCVVLAMYGHGNTWLPAWVIHLRGCLPLLLSVIRRSHSLLSYSPLPTSRLAMDRARVVSGCNTWLPAWVIHLRGCLPPLLSVIRRVVAIVYYGATPCLLVD